MLNQLKIFKESKESLPSLERLALLINNRNSIHTKTLFNILYSYKDLEVLDFTAEHLKESGIKIKKIINNSISTFMSIK